MTYTIDIQNDVPYLIDNDRLRQAVTAILNQHEIDRTSALSIVFTDNAAVQKLNLEHRQTDAPTDVLSFPTDSLPDYITDESPYLGDLIIAYPYASLQAKKHHHELSDSLCLLVIHGTLHLLGYDHDTPDNRAEMWTTQASGLRLMGIDTNIVPALEGNFDD